MVTTVTDISTLFTSEVTLELTSDPTLQPTTGGEASSTSSIQTTTKLITSTDSGNNTDNLIIIICSIIAAFILGIILTIIAIFLYKRCKQRQQQSASNKDGRERLAENQNKGNKYESPNGFSGPYSVVDIDRCERDRYSQKENIVQDDGYVDMTNSETDKVNTPDYVNTPNVTPKMKLKNFKEVNSNSKSSQHHKRNGQSVSKRDLQPNAYNDHFYLEILEDESSEPANDIYEEYDPDTETSSDIKLPTVVINADVKYVPQVPNKPQKSKTVKESKRKKQGKMDSHTETESKGKLGVQPVVVKSSPKLRPGNYVNVKPKISPKPKKSKRILEQCDSSDS